MEYKTVMTYVNKEGEAAYYKAEYSEFAGACSAEADSPKEAEKELAKKFKEVKKFYKKNKKSLPPSGSGSSGLLSGSEEDDPPLLTFL